MPVLLLTGAVPNSVEGFELVDGDVMRSNAGFAVVAVH